MSHSCANILIHAVYSTKERHPFLTESDIRNELFHYIGGILRNNGAQPLGVNGFVEHVYMLFAIHPDCKIAQTIKETKRASSIWIKRKGERYQKFSWQTGYCALSVSESIKTRVQKYIDAQEAHHKRISFHDEWMALMKANHFPLPDWMDK